MTGSSSSGKHQKEKCSAASSSLLQYLPNPAVHLTSTNHCQVHLTEVPGRNQEAHYKYILNNLGAVLICIAINHSLRYLHTFTCASLFILPLPNKGKPRYFL